MRRKMISNITCHMQSLRSQFQWSARTIEHRTYHVEESAIDSFCNTIQLWRVGYCDIMFDTQRFGIFCHLVYVFCSTVSTQFLDFASSLSFYSCLIFLECSENH